MGTYCITGSASGMGAATAAKLTGEGHRVIGVDLHDADVEVDLATTAGRAAAIEQVLAHCDGRLDGLAPCAGVSSMKNAEPTVRINYFGTMGLLEGLRGALLEGAPSTVCIISSNSTTMTPGLKTEDADIYLAGDEEAAVAHFAESGWMAYPAGKLALAYWVRAHAVKPEWIGAGIRINAVAPGVIETNMTIPLLDQPGMAEALKAIPIPIGRWGQAAELAEVIAFLLSPGSSYMVGQTIFADGGTDALLQPRVHPHPLPAM